MVSESSGLRCERLQVQRHLHCGVVARPSWVRFHAPDPEKAPPAPLSLMRRSQGCGRSFDSPDRATALPVHIFRPEAGIAYPSDNCSSWSVSTMMPGAIRNTPIARTSSSNVRSRVVSSGSLMTPSRPSVGTVSAVCDSLRSPVFPLSRASQLFFFSPLLSLLKPRLSRYHATSNLVCYPHLSFSPTWRPWVMPFHSSLFRPALLALAVSLSLTVSQSLAQDVIHRTQLEIAECRFDMDFNGSYETTYLPQSSDPNCPCFSATAPPISPTAPAWPGCGPGAPPVGPIVALPPVNSPVPPPTVSCVGGPNCREVLETPLRLRLGTPART